MTDTVTAIMGGAVAYLLYDKLLYRQQSETFNAIVTPKNAPAPPGGEAVKNAPLGIRNNNPGNLKWVAANNWVGKLAKSGAFERFDTPEHGLRAAAIVLKKYITQKGFNTLAKIGPNWSPDGIGLSGQYARNAAAGSGLGVNQVLGTDSATMIKLLKGINAAENGAKWVNYYPDAVYAAAVAGA